MTLRPGEVFEFDDQFYSFAIDEVQEVPVNGSRWRAHYIACLALALLGAGFCFWAWLGRPPHAVFAVGAGALLLGGATGWAAHLYRHG